MPSQEIGLGNGSEMTPFCRVRHKSLTQSMNLENSS